jgi:hypothetical protein
MDSNFKNLKKEYREFIKNSVDQIKRLNINENHITKEKCIEINNLYDNLYNSIEQSSTININDVNHIILNYEKNDPDVEFFKRFILIKNIYMIKKIVKSTTWGTFIEKLSEELKLKKKDKHSLEKGVYKLLKQTCSHFRGCWEICDYKDDKIKKLEIIEPEHIEFLLNYIKSK